MTAPATEPLVDLSPAPAAAVVAGAPLFGAYAGAIPRVHWDGLEGGFARSAMWRFLHGKRWHYASIAGPRVIAALAIVDVGYATNAFAYLFDRHAGVLRADFGLLGLPRVSAHVTDRPAAGAVSTFARPGASLRLERRGAAWEVAARGPGGFVLDATLDASAAPPTLCAIAEIAGGVANCTHKTACLPVHGTAAAGGVRFALDGHTASLDHTLGLLARETTWRWASAAGPGLGLNLVAGFNGPLGPGRRQGGERSDQSNENVLWHEGRVHPVGAADIVFDAANTRAPWRVRTQDGAVDLTFRPEGERRQDENLGFAASRYVQPFGTFHGVVRPGGREVVVRDLAGVTEDHAARW